MVTIHSQSGKTLQAQLFRIQALKCSLLIGYWLDVPWKLRISSCISRPDFKESRQDDQSFDFSASNQRFQILCQVSTQFRFFGTIVPTVANFQRYDMNLLLHQDDNQWIHMGFKKQGLPSKGQPVAWIPKD
jgi:hypothetical protein